MVSGARLLPGASINARASAAFSAFVPGGIRMPSISRYTSGVGATSSMRTGWSAMARTSVGFRFDSAWRTCPASFRVDILSSPPVPIVGCAPLWLETQHVSRFANSC